MRSEVGLTIVFYLLTIRVGTRARPISPGTIVRQHLQSDTRDVHVRPDAPNPLAEHFLTDIRREDGDAFDLRFCCGIVRLEDDRLRILDDAIR